VVDDPPRGGRAGRDAPGVDELRIDDRRLIGLVGDQNRRLVVVQIIGLQPRGQADAENGQRHAQLRASNAHSGPPSNRAVRLLERAASGEPVLTRDDAIDDPAIVLAEQIERPAAGFDARSLAAYFWHERDRAGTRGFRRAVAEFDAAAVEVHAL